MSAETITYCDLSDEFLFALVKQDDQKAFGEIYNRYWSFLLDIAYRPIQSSDVAKDMVQDIFISLYQRRRSIELTVSLKAYLWKSMKFRVLNEIRSQTVRQTYKNSMRSVEERNIECSHNVEVRELEEMIDKSIEQLPVKCKNAFLLSREENFSYKDISGHLDISVSTVEKHVSKALKVLRMNLNLYL